MIYLDNAATTKTSPAAQTAMLHCMEAYWGTHPASTPRASGPPRR